MTSRGEPREVRHLLLFAKVPEAGRTKTRLAPALGAEGAADLYRAFLRDTADRLAQVPADARELWVPGPPERARGLAEGFPSFRLRRQRGPDLGARLRHALGAAFEGGADRAVVVGSDHPTLPADHLEAAFGALDDADVALGPTPDGGYWAVAVRASAWPAAGGLFRDVPWSTPDALAATEANGRRLGLEVGRLPSWYDVDEPAGLERLHGDVEWDSATAEVLARLRGETGGGGRR